MKRRQGGQGRPAVGRTMKQRGQGRARVLIWTLLFSSMSFGCLELAAIGLLSELAEDDSHEPCDSYYEGAPTVASQLEQLTLRLSSATASVRRDLLISIEGVTIDQTASLNAYLSAQVRYPPFASVPLGELRELPRVRITLASPDNAFTSASSTTQGGAVLDSTAADVSAALTQGTDSQQLVVGVTVARVDGAPFGEVEVQLNGRATLTLGECPAAAAPAVRTEWREAPSLGIEPDAGAYLGSDAGNGDAGPVPSDAGAASDAEMPWELDGGGGDAGSGNDEPGSLDAGSP